MFTQVKTLADAGSPRRAGSLEAMSKLFRAALTVGFALVGVVAVAACGDSSTATAPLTQDVTTRQVSSEDSSSSSAAAEASSQAEEAASKATSTLPATKPDSSTKVPGNFPGGGGGGAAQLTDKEQAYLAALKQQKVAFMGDDDGSVSLSMGHYVCDAQAKKVDPMLIKVTVRAGIGPMTDNEDQANAKADKLIATADQKLC